MGSMAGAYLAAVMVSVLKAVCIALGTVSVLGVDLAFPKLTLVLEFLFMAVVLVLRPWGLLGKPQALSRHTVPPSRPWRPGGPKFAVLCALIVCALFLLPSIGGGLAYAPAFMMDVMIAVLFAVSLHFLMGPGGMTSFGHAAYLGLGAYATALVYKAAWAGMTWALLLGPLTAGVAALLFGWFCIRLSGVYLAMLSLAFAQIVWSIIFQSDELTGGSNGLLGIWPDGIWVDGRYYYLLIGIGVVMVWLVRRIIFSPFGYAMRAVRDAELRAQACGIPLRQVRWLTFVLAGTLAGLAGSLFAFSKGSVAPEIVSVAKSVDGLVMVMLGGVQTLSGPVVGAVAFSFLHDYLLGITQYWRALLGLVIVLLIMLFPRGLAGSWTFGADRPTQTQSREQHL